MLRLSIAQRIGQRLSIRCFCNESPKNAFPSKEEIIKKKTPTGKLDEKEDKPYSDPHLPRHSGGVNPKTGEVGGPAGVEPTRYGDWERKGRVTDF
ncbi:hypothetical protein WR25_03594 [Diploscapter pachys]|uniref:Succinate dehydrogenase assembly factor 4, mitochondrial n=1 Tax=Diploscapter pachys TaxID=2018661 RepID=A0A2A2LGT5_9BILA|nr:hypothetical protein WR25_03594 [Diploscapter pachys]